MVDNKWPPNLHVDIIAMCVITESRRETSFIEAAYLIFFFFSWSCGTRMDTTYLSNLKNKQTNLKPQMVNGKVPHATLEGLS